ncbi:MAG: GGDEF domain-containing protein [Chloroflexi bacterium]|nr:GGDEF domain-containing protein [Chloroflexota bacterium]
MSAPRNDGGCADMATSLGVDDILVFAHRGSQLSLLGGAGRGVGWAGVVDVELADEPLARETLRRGRPKRVSDGESRRVIGPYWAEHAALIPVGDRHLVVFGASRPIQPSDGELLRAAAESAAACGDVPSSKLLADELEVVHAVRQLMEYRPDSVAATASHVGAMAAAALSCEIGLVLVDDGDRVVIGGGGQAWPQIASHPHLQADLEALADRIDSDTLVDQEVDGDPLGIHLVSRFAIRIGTPAPVGLLVVGHTSARARGFTVLCQRVGRSIAEAAEALLAQAAAREALARERDAYAREARTDPLTGLGNRIAWEEALRREEALFDRHGRPVALLSLDVDRLKETNDAFGHAAGDEILAGAADVLTSTLRATDLVARLGGDEFAALLPETDSAALQILEGRIAEASSAWRGANAELRLSISIGSAAATPGERLRDAFHRADAALMRSKGAR